MRAGLDFIHGLHEVLHLLIAQGDLLAGVMRLAPELQSSACSILYLIGNGVDPCRQFLHGACLLHGSLTECLGAFGQLAAGRGHLVSGAVDLHDDITQLCLHMTHGEQDIAEVAHIGILVLRVDIQILACQLVKQIADIMDNAAQALYQGGGGSYQHAGLIFACDLRHGCLEIALHQQLHSLRTGLHGLADASGKHQGYDYGDKYGEKDHTYINRHAEICSGQIIQLGCGDGYTPTVRIPHRRIGDKHISLCAFIASEPVLPLAHCAVDCRQIL